MNQDQSARNWRELIRPRGIESDDEPSGTYWRFACEPLERGYGVELATLAGEDFSLRALDGYTRPSTGAQLAESGGHLAFADAALSEPDGSPRFAPIDRRQVDPRSLRANIERLHGENPQGSIVIQADQKSQNHLLVQVMDAARLAGVYNVSIAAQETE